MHEVGYIGSNEFRVHKVAKGDWDKAESLWSTYV
jgi:hypothetical protein